MSDCEEVSQCSSEPSSEHVNRWSGLDGWKWTSHTIKEQNSMKEALWRIVTSVVHLESNLTLSRVGLHEGEGCAPLSHVPDTEHSVLTSRGYNVLLVRVSINTVERDSVPRPKGKQIVNVATN